jgi:5'-nucleotidase
MPMTTSESSSNLKKSAMNRRKFIKQSAIATSALSLSTLPTFGFNQAQATKRLTILHTNDVHSHVEPFAADHPRNPNMGGVARRATLINQIRAEQPNVLLLDAGDSFQGTPYFNYYGGEIEWKLMSMMGYDATTLGNHEFDNGLEGLLNPMKQAKFDIINANYDFKNTILDGKIKPYKIYEKDNLKIGIFGLGVELQGLVNKIQYGETVYLNPLEIAQDMTRLLKYDKKCDLIICLSHLGYNYKNEPDKISDLILAKKTKDIDLIIGGHTHTFLDKPTVVKNLVDQDVIVNQVGAYGINLGRIDFEFVEKSKKLTTTKQIEIL